MTAFRHESEKPDRPLRSRRLTLKDSNPLDNVVVRRTIPAHALVTRDRRMHVVTGRSCSRPSLEEASSYSIARCPAVRVPRQHVHGFVRPAGLLHPKRVDDSAEEAGRLIATQELGDIRGAVDQVEPQIRKRREIANDRRCVLCRSGLLVVDDSGFDVPDA